ncbi:hypothetical protein P4U47_01275 [Bacillus altitudinis]|uniref:hypothetical protein n=1 Tax=Bacillus altitudinis TaxID=293387 RepID=UPI002E1F9F05|nr:hypothetical protein [Bacillus altitudinis]
MEREIEIYFVIVGFFGGEDGVRTKEIGAFGNYPSDDQIKCAVEEMSHSQKNFLYLKVEKRHS